MANSINGIGSSSVQNTNALEISGASKPDVQPTSAEGAVSTPAQTSDSTELSNIAAIIAASRLAGTQPMIRTELITSLRAQIASGTYRPDSDEVAARIAAAIGS